MTRKRSESGPLKAWILHGSKDTETYKNHNFNVDQLIKENNPPPWKINMEPENNWVVEESSLPKDHF